MIEDFNRLGNGTDLDADLCIVGAGAAGISLALQFVSTSRRVLLLEAGGLKADPATQSLYAGEVADEKLHAPPDKYRQRRYGGSTTIWGGRCMPFDPIDFEQRPYIAASGWPFGYEALRPYYVRANHLCEAGAFAYTAEQAFPEGMPEIIDGFRSGRITANTLVGARIGGIGGGGPPATTSILQRYADRMARDPLGGMMLYTLVAGTSHRSSRVTLDGQAAVSVVCRSWGREDCTGTAR